MSHKITLLSDVSGVNAEKNTRVTLPAGTYDLAVRKNGEVIEPKETKPGSFSVAVQSPSETHPGGADGKTECPCTIWAQVPADVIEHGEHHPKSRRKHAEK